MAAKQGVGQTDMWRAFERVARDGPLTKTRQRCDWCTVVPVPSCILGSIQRFMSRLIISMPTVDVFSLDSGRKYPSIGGLDPILSDDLTEQGLRRLEHRRWHSVLSNE